MKVVLVFSFFSLAAFSQQQEPTLEDIKNVWRSAYDPIKDDCIAETGADPTLADRIIDFGEYPDNKRLKCFTRCMWQQANLLDSDGEMQMEVFRKLIGTEDANVISKFLEKCSNTKGADECDAIYELAKCIHGNVLAAMTP